MRHCGILNIDKPLGMTSREVVDRVLKLVRPAKVGHAGTLDPLATGVLVVCVGHATRLINLIQEGRKGYLGRFVLGQHSDTDDVTGTMTHGGDFKHVTRADVERLLPEFTGNIAQVPPQYSAVHVQGRRAYQLARSGQSVELSARPVDIHSIRLTEFTLPEFELEIECGSGTYVRSIGRDLGLRLGCGAVMSQLKRVAVGAMTIDKAIGLDCLNGDTLGSHLMPALSAVSHLRHQPLTADEIVAIRRGQQIQLRIGSSEQENSDPSKAIIDSRIALITDVGQLIGIGDHESTGIRVQPRIVFPADESAT